MSKKVQIVHIPENPEKNVFSKTKNTKDILCIVHVSQLSSSNQLHIETQFTFFFRHFSDCSRDQDKLKLHGGENIKCPHCGFKIFIKKRITQRKKKRCIVVIIDFLNIRQRHYIWQGDEWQRRIVENGRFSTWFLTEIFEVNKRNDSPFSFEHNNKIILFLNNQSLKTKKMQPPFFKSSYNITVLVVIQSSKQQPTWVLSKRERIFAKLDQIKNKFYVSRKISNAA